MKNIPLYMLLLLFFVSTAYSTDICINEFLADNSTTVTDSNGEYDDWIELYNFGATFVNLEGLYLSDDAANLFKWEFPDTNLNSESFLIVWADNDIEQSGLHAGFKISANGESLFLTNSDSVVIDEIHFGTQIEDVSFGRFPDGTGDFIKMIPSLGTANNDDYLPDDRDIFNQDLVHKFELFFDFENWDDTLKHYFEEQDESYYPARLVYNDEIVLDTIGVRYKGNSSYTISRNSIKKPFKMRFDKYIDGQKLLDVEKLNFSNCVNDPSFLREVISYEILREYMPAPRTAYADIWVNGEQIGFYVQVEQIDEIFLSNHFPDNSGNLYKASDDGATLLYRGDNQSEYEDEYALKTNEDTNDWSEFIYFINLLNNTPDSLVFNTLDSILDFETSSRLLTFNMLLSNFDSYTGSGRNFYFYNNPATNKFVMLPWDFNESFGVYPNNWNVLTQDIAYTSNLNQRPLLKQFVTNDSLFNLYKNQLLEMMQGAAGYDVLMTRAQEIQDFIEPYVLTDENKFYSNEDFCDNLYDDLTVEMGRSVPGIENFLSQRYNNLVYQLSDTRVFPGDADNNGVVDEYDIIPIGLYLLQTGHLRYSDSFLWSEQNAISWPDSLATYADCNGDGVINEVDVIGIGVNWGNTSGINPSNSANFRDFELSVYRDNFQILLNSLSNNQSESALKIKSLLKSILLSDQNIVQRYELGQNYPNPFNPTTTIPFSLASNGPLSISIYNLLGQRVLTPVNAVYYNAGSHQYLLDASSLASGTYFYELRTNSWKKRQKMMVIK